MSRINLGLLAILVVRGLLAIGLPLLVLLTGAQLFLERFFGPEVTGVAFGLKVYTAIFALFCVCALPFAYRYAANGQLTFIKSLSLGALSAVVPVGLLAAGRMLQVDPQGFDVNFLLSASLFSFVFGAIIGALFWCFGLVADVILSKSEKAQS